MIPAPIEGAPAVAQPTGSLRASARPLTADRWENGVAWRPEICFSASGYGPCDPDPTVPPDIPADDGPEMFFPQGYRVRDFCTSLGGRLDEDRLRRQAEATASFQAAQELWTGALTAANPVTVGGSPYVNPSLAGSPTGTTVTGGTTVAEKLGLLEQEAMEAAKGGQVFIHLPPRFVLPLGNLIERRGELLYTPLGNVIVADAGYPGTGPGGTGDSWAFATGPVTVGFSPIVPITDMAETLNRRTNRQEIWADRLFVATYDPCIEFAIDLAAA